MEPSNQQDDNLMKDPKKALNPEVEFDKLAQSNPDLGKLAKVAEIRYTQLKGRYKEANDKMHLKLTDTLNSFKTLNANIHDVSVLTTVMGLLRTEFEDAKKEYEKKLIDLQKFNQYDFNFADTISKHGMIVMTIKDMIKSAEFMVESSVDQISTYENHKTEVLKSIETSKGHFTTIMNERINEMMTHQNDLKTFI